MKTPSIWLTKRALTLHLALVVSVPCFVLLWLWQLHRALGGNSLSWAYTFEWPFFCAYAIWMWWRLLHDESALPGRSSPAGDKQIQHQSAGSAPVVSAEFDPYNDEVDPELAAYNRYLASLHAEDKKASR